MAIIALAVSLICGLWMLVKIWQWNMLVAIISLFFWPAVLLPLVRNWGNEEYDIKVPFFCSLGFGALASYKAIGKPSAIQSLLEIVQMAA